ncbi:MAG: DUF1990 domain-containing protein [Chloroflexota bacterium]|nr:DUF1990 domain-containing protein [Chloroflexota bacterium]
MLRPVLAARLRSRPVAFERWRRRAITAVDADIAGWPLDEYAKVVPGPSSSPGDAEGAFERVRERILELRLFPPQSIVLHADTPDGRAALGVTIVQHLFLGPLALESGVRIVGCEDGAGAGPRRVSVTWATLKGHPERGVETFSASLGSDGAIQLGIHARSRPGTLLVRLGSPLARRLQVRLSHRSLALLEAAVDPQVVAEARGGG